MTMKIDSSHRQPRGRENMMPLLTTLACTDDKKRDEEPNSSIAYCCVRFNQEVFRDIAAAENCLSSSLSRDMHML